jgi:hypothetical protein
MKVYKRTYPVFSLCGLNCVLCPRYNDEGSSRCPGCGGNNFYEKHPSCKVINCSLKQGNIEFCFECVEYPCERYNSIGEKDSFISYKNVKVNLNKAKKDLSTYLDELNERKILLEKLILKYNDGKSKSFFCLVANNISLPSLKKCMKEIENIDNGIDKKEVSKEIRLLFQKYAKKEDVDLELRK